MQTLPIKEQTTALLPPTRFNPSFLHSLIFSQNGVETGLLEMLIICPCFLEVSFFHNDK